MIIRDFKEKIKEFENIYGNIDDFNIELKIVGKSKCIFDCNLNSFVSEDYLRSIEIDNHRHIIISN